MAGHRPKCRGRVDARDPRPSQRQAARQGRRPIRCDAGRDRGSRPGTRADPGHPRRQATRSHRRRRGRQARQPRRPVTAGPTGGEKAGRGLRTGFLARAGPIAFVVVGLILTVGFARAWRGDLAGATAPWWAYLFLMLLAVAMLALAAALVIDPRPMPLRQALGGAALVWLGVLVIIAIGATGLARARGDGWLLVVLVAVIGGTLVDLAVTTPSVVDAGSSGPPAAMARLGAVILFALAIFMATGAAVIFVSLARAIWRSATRGEPIDRLPWGL